MKKMSLVNLGALLLLLHLLSSQVVQAQNGTATTPSNKPTTMNHTMTHTMTPIVNMTSPGKNGSGRSAALTPLLTLTLAASVLHGWS